MFSESIWLDTGLLLLRMTLAGTLWLTLGGALLLAIREPARRTRACGLILLGCLLIPPLVLTVPGNLWGPPAVVQIDGMAPAERGFATSTRGAHANPSPNAEPVPLELANVIEDSTEEPSGWVPTEVDPPANRVANTARYGVTSISPAEAAFSWWGIGSATYLFGAGVVALWYVAGLSGLARLVRGSRVPTPSLESVWQAVRGDDLTATPLLVSGDLRQPIACWWGRAIVLLPAGWSDVARERIEAALAHEAEHVRRGDFWWWQAANLARIVFWFHPLVWWLRRELRIGQDFLADAAVVRSRQSTVDYAEFLTSSACLDPGHTPLVGLGLLGRRSELYRRVAMLLKRERPLELRAPRWWNAALLAGGVLALGAVMTMRVIADPSSSTVPLSPAQAADRRSLSPPRIASNDSAPATLTDPFAAEGPSTGALPPLGPPDPAPGNASGVNPFSAGVGVENDPSFAPPRLGLPRAEAPPVPGAESGAFSGALPSNSPSPFGASGSGQLPPSKQGRPAPMPLAAATVIRKLVIQNETVEPEAGVAISIVSLSDAAGSSWKLDGSRIDSGEGGSGGYSLRSPGMGGPPAGYASAGSSMMAAPGGVFPLSAEARQRIVTLRVQRPLPVGLHLSVDGQSVSRTSTSLPDSRARQITQTAFWPDEQMEGSVGVRFASKTVARELTASNREGETVAIGQAGIEARLGAWRQGSDLQTEIPLDGVQPTDPTFVIVAQAVDVEGTAHPGRIEHRRNGGRSGAAGGIGGGMPMGMSSAGMDGTAGGGEIEEWLMVFPHLPADRIAKVRLTWHPYAWVIFRNVSLEPDHKTTPTAELYIDAP